MTVRTYKSVDEQNSNEEYQAGGKLLKPLVNGWGNDELGTLERMRPQQLLGYCWKV